MSLSDPALLSSTEEIEYAFFLPSLPTECLRITPARIEQAYFDVNKIAITLREADRDGLATLCLNVKGNQASLIFALTPKVVADFSAAMSVHPEQKGCFMVPADPLSYCARLRCKKKADSDGQEIGYYELTVKGPGRTAVGRTEANLRLPLDTDVSTINALYEMASGTIIVKDRYVLPVAGSESLMWEVDQFLSPFALVKAECEVPDISIAAPEAPAHWSAVNITGQRQFDNASLVFATRPPVPDHI